MAGDSINVSRPERCLQRHSTPKASLKHQPQPPADDKQAVDLSHAAPEATAELHTSVLNSFPTRPGHHPALPTGRPSRGTPLTTVQDLLAIGP
jgi:hypothetical protein